jgi:outer membrane lipoprotein-sorting protein
MNRFYAAAARSAAAAVLISGLAPLSPARAEEEADRAKSALPSPARPAAPDPRTAALLQRVQAAYRRANTLTADFTYSVTSVKRQQIVEGSLKLKRPNLARVTYTTLREPAYPNLIASDGKRIYTFTPDSFNRATRRFRNVPFRAALGVKQASGAVAGGGTITSAPAAPDGGNIHLWDATPVQAFFDPTAAIRGTLFVADPNTLQYEGTQTLDGVTFRVLRHHYENGNIAGGEQSAFDQRLYIGPDDLIHQYVLEFRSGGRPGVQVVRLRNIRVNTPLRNADFAFTPPVKKR